MDKVQFGISAMKTIQQKHVMKAKNMLMVLSRLHELYRLNVKSAVSTVLVLLLKAHRNLTFWILANSGNRGNRLNVVKPQVLTMKREERSGQSCCIVCNISIPRSMAATLKDTGRIRTELLRG